jgi:hypothetical protein
LPAVVQVNAPVGIRVIVPPPVEIGTAAVIVTTAVVPEIKVMGAVGAIVVALAIVGAAALTALKPLNERLVPVAAPRTGVIKVGVFEKTNVPAPVSSVTAAAKLALVGVAKNVAMPEPSPLMPVETGSPVQLVKAPLVGVPNTGVTITILVLVQALMSPLATVPNTGVTITILVLVQALMLPLATVPKAGATNVELVNSSALVTFFVVPPWTIGKTSVVAAAVAAGKADIAMVAILVISCVNVKPLTGGDNSVRH